MKKIAAEDLDQKDTESDFDVHFEKLDLKESSWIYNRSESTTFHLYKEVTKVGRSFVELPIKTLRLLNIQTKLIFYVDFCV